MAEPHPVVTYSKKGAKFQDVREDLKLAIEERGLVIDYVSYVNRMLERTGKDVGSARKLYADAQAFVFCSAALSRKTMEADPANVSFCPYSLMVYSVPSKAGEVEVHDSYRCAPWRRRSASVATTPSESSGTSRCADRKSRRCSVASASFAEWITRSWALLKSGEGMQEPGPPPRRPNRRTRDPVFEIGA